ncbi:aggregation-promoting factor C-terminal-like domain-containing protein [Microbacterium gorillae]|uniref:aggregation-promoting factor C-terminal-like domain-containing protein n=1 Tax=Microbacterium gorillae TaxID=1231063 RepID=UPI0005908F39|nr:transglycosylase SLT domain-containing protein [Microbacterium gorillae]
MAVFSVLAATGLAAASVVPAVAAFSDPGVPVTSVEAATAYGHAVAGAQDLTADASVVTNAIDERGSYQTYVTPTPTPTPTPEPEPEPAGESDGGSHDNSSNGGFPQQYTGGGAPAEWMAAAGIAQSDWGYVDYIVSHESGWNPNATNSGSGACGLVQALPCSKVEGNGYDPVDNLRWGNGYAVGRYGSWGNAYAFWTANNWW